MKLLKAVSKNLGGKEEQRMINGVAEKKKKKNDVKISLSRERQPRARSTGTYQSPPRAVTSGSSIESSSTSSSTSSSRSSSDDDFRTVSRENQSHSNCDLSINILIRNSICGSRDDYRR